MLDQESRQSMMGWCHRWCRRTFCRRFGLNHLRLGLFLLLIIFSVLLVRFTIFLDIGDSKSDHRDQSSVQRSGKFLFKGERKDNADSHEEVAPPDRNSGVSRNITRSLYIHGELKVISTWRELEEFVNCIRVEEGKPNTRPCLVQCPSGDKLEITLDSKLQNAKNKDAILFGLSPFTLLWSFNTVMGYQPPENQLVVFYSMETVMRMHKWNPRIGRLRYHVDMTYGAYSNISIPYAFFTPFPENNTKVITKNWMEGKTKLIAWMASNCKEVFWPRNEFVAELQRHMKIDTYGRCGNLTCLPRLSPECTKMLTKYKFYLSIENSECDDYLTEKIWDSALRNDVVPVVYGARKADYEKYAPPHSFIHFSDFKSVPELATYLKRVANNKILYNSYFKWREQGTVIQKYPTLKPTYFCKLLPYIEHIPAEMHAVKDSGWFSSCRHQLKVHERLNLTKVQQLKDWKPW